MQSKIHGEKVQHLAKFNTISKVHGSSSTSNLARTVESFLHSRALCLSGMNLRTPQQFSKRPLSCGNSPLSREISLIDPVLLGG